MTVPTGGETMGEVFKARNLNKKRRGRMFSELSFRSSVDRRDFHCGGREKERGNMCNSLFF